MLQCISDAQAGAGFAGYDLFYEILTATYLAPGTVWPLPEFVMINLQQYKTKDEFLAATNKLLKRELLSRTVN